MYPKFILSLLDKDNNEKMKFNLNLLNLAFLGEELYTTSFHYYPMFIIEFMKGYYTTAELYEKNEALMNNNITNNIIKPKESQDSLDDNLKIEDNSNTQTEESKTEETFTRAANTSVYIPRPQKDKKFSLDKDDSSNNGNNANIKESVRASSFSDFEDSEIKKNKEKYKLSMKPKLKSEILEVKDKKIITINYMKYFDTYLEKIMYFRKDNHKKKESEQNNIQIENCDNIIEVYKRKERIVKIKKQIEYYKRKSEEIKKTKQRLQKIIANKKNILTNLNSNINSYKDYCKKLEDSNKKSLPLVIQHQMIYNSFLNKKMVEICFFFFNKKIKNIYLIQDILKKNIKNDNESIRNRCDYYNNNKKRISSMMGYIAQLMIYFSKCFDIPLPYPLCLNGSKSFVVRGKKDKEKDFLPLHCDLKREDKYGNFETGLNYLKIDLNEIINFFAVYRQIISENEYDKIYKNKENNVFFYFFINFNQCLLQFLKNILKTFD